MARNQADGVSPALSETERERVGDMNGQGTVTMPWLVAKLDWTFALSTPFG